jgi:hypothetical protein
VQHTKQCQHGTHDAAREKNPTTILVDILLSFLTFPLSPIPYYLPPLSLGSLPTFPLSPFPSCPTGAQVEEVAASLNSEDVFVLTTPKAIYVWKGNSYSDTDVHTTFLFPSLP